MSNTNEWVRATWTNELEGKRIKVTRGDSVLVGVHTQPKSDYLIQLDGAGTVKIPNPGLWEPFVENPVLALPTAKYSVVKYASHVPLILNEDGLWYYVGNAAVRSWPGMTSEEVARKHGYESFTNYAALA